jgi:Flp pilus assembly protein TadG
LTSGKCRTWLGATAKLRDSEGSQILEFALAMPLLLVLAIAIMDFGQAFNVKQQLNNAAREGARYAADQSSELNDLETQGAAQAVGNVVQNYLTNAGLKQCTFTASSYSTVTYSYTSGTGCGLTVNRGYDASGTGGTVISTQVTLTYPFSWKLTKLIKLLLHSSTLSLPATLSSNAIMPNIN